MELFDVYPLMDIIPEKASGRYVYTQDGNRYLDFYGGHAVISIGHSHPHYVQKISEQLQKLCFYSNSVVNPLQQKLANTLGELAGYDDYQLFLSNSGAEAVENALKVASFENGKDRVIAFNKGFHGRTSAAISVTDKPTYRAPVNQNMDVTFLELNDSASLRKELENGNVSAVIVESIQGIGGIVMPEPNFLQAIEENCKEHDAIFICDEIQAGFGRTGHFFAHQHTGVKPDIITMAKGMGNGFPVAGTLFSPDFEPWHGELGTTYGGNHLACSAVLAVLEVIHDEDLIANAATLGDYLMEELQDLPLVSEVRGKGLMIGIECTVPIKQIRSTLIHDKNIITGVSSNPNVLRILPPLSLTKPEATHFITELTDVLTTFSNHETLHLS